MDQAISFTYSYSAGQNKEVEAIREKYLPKQDSKIDELRRLDAQVEKAGMIESLSVGIIGSLIFGVALCMGLGVLAGGIILAVLVGIVGGAIMIAAYPVYRKVSNRVKAEKRDRILALVKELE